MHHHVMDINNLDDLWFESIYFMQKFCVQAIHRWSFNILSVANRDSHIYLNMWFSKHHHVVFTDQRWWINSYFNGIIACKLNGKNKLFPFCIWFKFVIFLPADLLFISYKQKLKFFNIFFIVVFSWKNKLREFIATYFFFEFM